VPRYVRVFSLADVAELHRAFDRDFTLAERVIAAERRAGLPPTAINTLRLLEVAYADMNRGLDALAKRTAVEATAAIKQRIAATRARNRGDTGRGQHLRNAVKSRALPRVAGLATGEVGVADVAVLDALVNPIGGYGSYWRAQEYGTGVDSPFGPIPSQVGRVIRGYFFGRGFSGTPEPPREQYRGLGVGPSPIFVGARAGAAAFGGLGFAGGAGRQGGKGGYGTISVDLPGRHFVRDGADVARTNWLRGIRAIEWDTRRALRAATRLP
jgi:hypothetical protein